MVVVFNKIKHEKKKFLITMIIIIASATMVNYGTYNLLEFYFEDVVDAIYKGIQMNILFTIVTIGIAIILMFAILPKETVDEMIEQISGEESDKNKTPEQILHDMIDRNGYEENNKK